MCSTREGVKAEVGLLMMLSHSRGAIAFPPVTALGVDSLITVSLFTCRMGGSWSRDTSTA